MPIRVTCQCGQTVNVPDNMAGKSGKCPKCQQLITIPNAATTPTTAPKPPTTTGKPGTVNTGKPATSTVAATKTSASAKLPSEPVVPSALDGLFEAAGLTQRKGKFCPACDAPVQQGAVLCVQCGLHFVEGTVFESHKVESQRQFGNKRLNEAADMMAREADTQKRMLKAGTPWWFMFAGLAGLVVFISGALIKMDSITSGQISSNKLMGRIQNANMLTVLIASAGSACCLVAAFSYMALVAGSFYESRKQGLLCLLAPLYIVYYMFSRVRERRLWSTVIMFWITLTLGIVSLVYALPKI